MIVDRTVTENDGGPPAAPFEEVVLDDLAIADLVESIANRYHGANLDDLADLKSLSGKDPTAHPSDSAEQDRLGVYRQFRHSSLNYGLIVNGESSVLLTPIREDCTNEQRNVHFVKR